MSSSGDVYFVQAGEAGLIKIGFSEDLERRVAELQTGSSLPLHLLGRVHGSQALERKVHQRFRHYRQHGEWFDPASELLDWISSILQGGAWLDDLMEERGNALIDKFLAAKVEAGMRRQSLRYYDLTLRRFWDFAGTWDAEPADVRAWLVYLRRTGLGRAVVVRHQRILSSFYSWLAGAGLIPRNPVEWPLMEWPEPASEPLTSAQVLALVSWPLSTDAPRLLAHAAIGLSLGCALLVPEILNLLPCDLYLSQGFVRVFSRKIDRRIVPLPWWVWRAVAAYVDSSKPTARLFHLGDWQLRELVRAHTEAILGIAVSFTALAASHREQADQAQAMCTRESR